MLEEHKTDAKRLRADATSLCPHVLSPTASERCLWDFGSEKVYIKRCGVSLIFVHIDPP
jgi:hypothetical protein